MPNNTNLKLNSILDSVTSVLGISRIDIYGSGRSREYVNARHITWWILNRKYKWSLARIGREFKRDHTTVMDAVLKINKQVILKVSDIDLMVDFKTVLEYLGIPYPEL